MFLKIQIKFVHPILCLVNHTSGPVHYLQSVFGLFHPLLVQFQYLISVHLKFKIIHFLDIFQCQIFQFFNFLPNLVLKPIILSFLLFGHCIDALSHISKVYRKLLIYLVLLVSIFNHRDLQKLHKVSKVLDLFSHWLKVIILRVWWRWTLSFFVFLHRFLLLFLIMTIRHTAIFNIVFPSIFIISVWFIA
jgi:hypothetical protein